MFNFRNTMMPVMGRNIQSVTTNGGNKAGVLRANPILTPRSTAVLGINGSGFGSADAGGGLGVFARGSQYPKATGGPVKLPVVRR